MKPVKVRMTLTCHINLSRETSESAGLIGELVEKANREAFLRGVSEAHRDEAARIEEWKLEGPRLTVELSSGSKVRAPSAVLRFRKLLAEELGRKFRVGVRGVEVPRLTIKLEGLKVGEEALRKIRSLEYVGEAGVEGETLTLNLNPLGEAELRRNAVDRLLGLVLKLAEEAEKPQSVEVHPVVMQGPQRPVKFRGDPAREAVKLGWVKEFPGRGQWVYTPPYVRLLEAVEQILVEEVAEKLGFQPFLLPKLIPLEVMRRMPGYLEEIPEGMYYVCPPPRDPEAFSRFKQALRVTGTVRRELLREALKEPDYVLAPAQCEPFWNLFSHETLRLEDLPYKFYDRAGWTYRWEGGGVEGLVRVQEFRRVELVYFGSPDQVVEIRDQVRDEIVRVADKLLEMEWRVVAALPFYMRGGEVGDISESRNVAAYDLEIYLPYRGERDRAEWLEIAGCFVHKDKFVKSFSIREARNRPLWTGCTGLGVTRWVAAFLATHGFNPESWPEPVKRRFKEYRMPRSLQWPKGLEEA
ncbi:MAG: serine--tRNA ligase [Candidatus Hecatellaceae archaeon]